MVNDKTRKALSSVRCGRTVRAAWLVEGTISADPAAGTVDYLYPALECPQMLKAVERP